MVFLFSGRWKCGFGQTKGAALLVFRPREGRQEHNLNLPGFERMAAVTAFSVGFTLGFLVKKDL